MNKGVEGCCAGPCDFLATRAGTIFSPVCTISTKRAQAAPAVPASRRTNLRRSNTTRIYFGQTNPNQHLPARTAVAERTQAGSWFSANASALRRVSKHGDHKSADLRT